MWDLVVVGAGPAGATAAIAARRADPGARVLLLDRATFPRDKVCGDGIAPHVLDVLGDLGVHGLVDDRVAVRTLELAHRGSSVTRDMRRPAWVVPRSVFDARLVAAAVDVGACLRVHRVRQLVVRPDRVVLDGVIEARVAVASDGAHSTVARAIGVPPPRRRALALRGYAPTPSGRRGRQVIRFGETPTPSYAWAFDRGDGWSNVGYGAVLPPSGRLPGRPHLVAALAALLEGSTDGARDWSGHHLPLAGVRVRQPRGRVLVVGDAAALVNPLSGEGIYYAVLSGAVAGRVAVTRDADAGTTYARRLRRALRSHLAAGALAAHLLAVPGALAVGLRASARDHRVFDDLVELGLGPGGLTPRLVTGFARSLLA